MDGEAGGTRTLAGRQTPQQISVREHEQAISFLIYQSGIRLTGFTGISGLFDLKSGAEQVSGPAPVCFHGA
jgi:hypothetical protein